MVRSRLRAPPTNMVKHGRGVATAGGNVSWPALDTASSRAEGGAMLDTPPCDVQTLAATTWRARAQSHLERVQRWTVPHRERRSRRERHPVYDFLFQYYSYSPGKLEAWHPGVREVVTDSSEAREHFGPPLYQAHDGLIRRDLSVLRAKDLEQQRSSVRLLVATQSRPPNFGCYGVHEWAMVYGGHDVRHDEVAPFRLPQKEVDAFVESRPVACSHFDAFRFFAPAAKPMNRMELEWSTRHEVEQPGCIHANMDLYRWAYGAMPWIGSDLLWQTFELATELRVLDMQASPYDLGDFGLEPVRVETDEGRAEYRMRQQELSGRAGSLRVKLIGALEEVLAACA